MPDRLKALYPVGVLLACVAAVWVAWWPHGSAPVSVQAAEAARATYLIQFGVDGAENLDWSGSVAAGQATVRSWQFDPKSDELTGNSWKCMTRRQSYWDTPYERVMGPTANREKVTGKGVWVDLNAPLAEVRITTKQGDFVFEPNFAPGDAARLFLNGRVSVQAVPSVQAVTGDGAAEDYPSMIEARDGTLWLAYQSYSQDRDQVFVRRFAKGAWSSPEPVSEPGDCYKTAIAQDKQGRVWVVWAEQRNGNFDLYSRSFNGKSWSKVERLTSAVNSDINHVMTSDSAGNLYLAWQSGRSGNFDVYLRVLRDGRWGAEIAATTNAANEWEPALAVAPNGSVAVLWDSYANGNYDIFERTFTKGQLGPVVNIATSEAFEARPSARFDAQSRLWIAWDEGDVNWGKDYGNLVGDRGRGLLVRRQVRLAVLDGGRLRQPAASLEASLPEEFRQMFQKPDMVLDASGNPWLFFRVRVNLPQERGGRETFRGLWRLYATALRGGKWSPLMEMSEGYGRIDLQTAVLARRNGEIAVAWATDGRQWPAGHPLEQDLRFAMIPKLPASGAVELVDYRGAAETRAAVHAKEVEDIARIREYRVNAAGKSWRIVRGDIHRHTDLSWDGNRDGSLDDSYRYALDAVAFDYLGVCDHQAGQGIPYNWARLQKAVDLYTIAGRFAPVYSYERSLPWPNGHRNVVFAERGRPVLAIPDEEQKGRVGAARLYAYLKQFSGVTTSHTSATGAGTDWRDSDPDVEPIVEIYQGYRHNYEIAGGPRSPGKVETTRFGLGFVSNAWAKGIKMGVQASSDHVSTHISYANFFVDAVDRKSIVEAMRARRSYASTDNIVVDWRLGDRLMGVAATPGTFAAVVIGTGPLKQVDVIRSNKVVYTVAGTGAEARFTYDDRERPADEAFYYIRVLQQDGQIAWSSPIWVK